MPRIAVVAAAGIGLLLVGALLVVYLATDTDVAPFEPPAPERAPEPPPLPTLPPAQPSQGVPGAPVAGAGPVWPSDQTGWEQARQLQIPDAVVARELIPPLAPCFERRGPVSNPPVLVMRLEAGASGLRVVDSQPMTPDRSTEDLVACAREILRDRKVTMSGPSPGERFESTLRLSDVSEIARTPNASGSQPGSASNPAFRRQRGKATGGVPPR